MAARGAGPGSVAGPVEVPVELDEVVGGGDEPPLGAGCGSSAAVKADEAAVVFGVAEDGLDELAALLVEAAAERGLEDAAHGRRRRAARRRTAPVAAPFRRKR